MSYPLPVRYYLPDELEFVSSAVDTVRDFLSSTSITDTPELYHSLLTDYIELCKFKSSIISCLENDDIHSPYVKGL